MNTPKTYGTPRTGTYFFAADVDHDAMNVAIVELAESFGWEAPEDAQATLDAVTLDDDQRANGPNHAALDALESLAKDAVEWLNEQETREDHVWESTMAGDFGLWHESAANGNTQPALSISSVMTTAEIITDRNTIARLALDGDTHYSHEAIGADDGDINDMETETGLPRVYRAESDSDVAVYSDGTRHVLVADANGPIAITLVSKA